MKKIFSKRARAPFLVGMMLFFSALIIYHRFLFGDGLWVFMDPDIGADTIQQYLPHYHTIINHIREGNFTFWDFNNGFGTSMFGLNLFDPSLMIVYALGVIFGPEHIAWYLIYMQVIRIVLAGTVFYHYLSCFTFSERAKCIVSYIYGLNGFLMVWGQHYQFGMAVVYLPLLLWSAERCMSRRRFHPPMVLAVGLSTLYSSYLSYMIFVCMGFYILVRLFGMLEGSRREKIRMLGILYGSMLLGIGLSAVAMFPTALYLMNTSDRISAGGGIFKRIIRCLHPYDRSYYKMLFYRFFSSYADGVNNLVTPDVPYTGCMNFYEDPHVFCSTLLPALACQYVCCLPRLSMPKKQKLLRLGLLAVFVFCLGLPFSGLVMNGFTASFSRHTFLMMPFFCLIMAEMLHALLREKTFSYLGLAISLLLFLFVLTRRYSSVIPLSHKRNLAVLCLTGILMSIVLFALAKNPKMGMQKLLYLCLLCLTTVSMVSEGCTSTLERLTLTKDNEEYFKDLYDPDIQSALDWLEEKDSQLYRTEKDFDTNTVFISYMDSLVQGYRGISTYNSTINGNIKRFVAVFYKDMLYNDKAHYRFSLVEDGQPLADLCGIRYLLSRKNAPNETYDKSGYRLIREFGNIQVYENRHETSFGRFYTDACTPKEARRYLKKHGTAKAREYILDHLIVEDLPEESLLHSQKKASAPAVSIQAPVRDDHLSGIIEAPEKGYVMLALPFEKGWKVYLDGREQEIFRANLGFQGIMVEKGTHQIELRYQAPGLIPGLVCSICCWTAFLLLAYRSRQLRRTSIRAE